MSFLQAIIISVLVQCILPINCLFETSKFVKKGKYDLFKICFNPVLYDFFVALIFTIIEFVLSEVCSDQFMKMDRPLQKMLASICETQCMIVCHATEGNFLKHLSVNHQMIYQYAFIIFSLFLNSTLDYQIVAFRNVKVRNTAFWEDMLLQIQLIWIIVIKKKSCGCLLKHIIIIEVKEYYRYYSIEM